MKKTALIAIALLASAALASAKDRPAYEKGKLVSMESVSCGYAENSGKSVSGEILGTDSAKKQTKEVLCQEYVLEGQHIIYRIRPKDDKHPVLLPVGEAAEFRIQKDKLLLRVPEGDGKEREYTVLSMTPRADDANSASAQKPKP